MDRAQTVLIEDKASGTQMIQELKPGSGGYRVKGYEPPPGTDKLLRLHAQTAVFEAGRVFLPTKAPWLAEYQRELITFPGAKHDDQVDSTTRPSTTWKKQQSEPMGNAGKAALEGRCVEGVDPETRCSPTVTFSVGAAQLPLQMGKSR